MKLWSLILPSLAASSLGVGCSLFDDELKSCVSGVEAGDQLQVTVVQRWQTHDAGVDAGDGVDSFGRSGASCERDDIKPGDTFTIQLNGEDRDTPLCKVLSCSDDFLSTSTASGTTLTNANTPLCASSHRKVSLTDTCEAERLVSLSDPLWKLGVDVPRVGVGEPVTLLLTRTFAATSSKRELYSCDQPSTVFPDAAVLLKDAYCTDSYFVSVAKK